METLQSWALCITFSAVGALLVHALVPKGATEKAIRVMISLFLLSAILSPFLSGKGRPPAGIVPASCRPSPDRERRFQQ